MNKSKSYPEIREEVCMRKSSSLDELKLDDFYFEEFFEGDGQLGIVFAVKNDGIFVKNILPKTVASETYGLYKSMILIDINNKDVSRMSLETAMKEIHDSWNKNSRVYLKFRKPIHKEVYTHLLNNELIKYYDQFVELGAVSLTDFEFVIYDDLVKMNMNRKDIENFRKINQNI